MNITLNITASQDVLDALNAIANAFSGMSATTAPVAEPKKKVSKKTEVITPEPEPVVKETVVEEKEVEKIEASKPEEGTSLEDIRAVAAEKTQDGKRLEVKALLTKYGAEKLPALDKAKYADFFTELKAL